MTLYDEQIAESTERVLNRNKGSIIPIDYLAMLVLYDACAQTKNNAKYARRIRRIQEFILNNCDDNGAKPFQLIPGRHGGIKQWSGVQAYETNNPSSRNVECAVVTARMTI